MRYFFRKINQVQLGIILTWTYFFKNFGLNQKEFKFEFFALRNVIQGNCLNFRFGNLSCYDGSVFIFNKSFLHLLECSASQASQARCLHGGTCVLESHPDGTTHLGCRCTSRFKGRRCETTLFWRTGVLGRWSDWNVKACTPQKRLQDNKNALKSAASESQGYLSLGFEFNRGMKSHHFDISPVSMLIYHFLCQVKTPVSQKHSNQTRSQKIPFSVINWSLKAMKKLHFDPNIRRY